MHFTPGQSCEICGKQDTELEECEMCGQQVCNECMSEEENLCLTCVDARCQICGEYLSSRACNKCGRLVCEDHGFKENEATICDICKASER
jgi:hypothetical protein